MSCHWLLMPLGGGQIDRQTNIPMCEQKRSQETRRAQQAVRTWYKNQYLIMGVGIAIRLPTHSKSSIGYYL